MLKDRPSLNIALSKRISSRFMFSWAYLLLPYMTINTVMAIWEMTVAIAAPPTP